MPRIQQAQRSQIFQSMSEEASGLNETNDCGVKAVAISCQVNYKVAHATLKKIGRKNRRGTYLHEIKAAISELNGKIVRRHKQSDLAGLSWFISQYPGQHKNLQSVTTHHPKRFNKVWKDGKTYLFFTTNHRHVAAVVNGKMCDWTEGRAQRVVEIWEVVAESDSIMGPMVH